jgi:hypothetical protein
LRDFGLSKCTLISWRGDVYLGGGSGTLNGILAFKAFDLFCFMIDHAFNFRLVETVYNGVFAFCNMDYTACDIRG